MLHTLYNKKKEFEYHFECLTMFFFFSSKTVLHKFQQHLFFNYMQKGIENRFKTLCITCFEMAPISTTICHKHFNHSFRMRSHSLYSRCISRIVQHFGLHHFIFKSSADYSFLTLWSKSFCEFEFNAKDPTHIPHTRKFDIFSCQLLIYNSE